MRRNEHQTSKEVFRVKKVLVFALVMSLLVIGTADARGTRPNCGCGLGSLVFEGQDGLMSQTAAATTNGTFGNQTFGISTGTLGCDRPDNFVQNEKVNEFVAGNMDNLAVDIAAGKGESLNTLADLIRMPTEKRPVFFTALRDNFDKVYPTPQITHKDVVENIAKIVAQI